MPGSWNCRLGGRDKRDGMAYNVLIVDDSKSMRKVLKKVLTVSGFRVGECLEAGNGKEALDLLANNWIDLVLSDIHMPVMDGIELMRRLNADKSYEDLPVVYVTTESNEARLQEVMTMGARGYIRKPFKPEEIRSLLADIMGEKDESGMASGNEECDF
jgi:two-component system chemotaxis response regulator CheY